MIYAGFDYSLTHGSVVGYSSTDNQYNKLLEYHRKEKPYMIISYKDRLFGKFDRALDSIVNYLENTKTKIDVLGIDSSALVHFNSARIQTFTTGYAIGYLRSELNKACASKVVLVTPAELRTFAKLKRNEKKASVQDWYLTNTPMSDMIDDSWTEDSIDAAIIAYYLFQQNSNHISIDSKQNT